MWIRSFFVCFSYDFKAALKIVWKREEATAVETVSDMARVASMAGLIQAMGWMLTGPPQREQLQWCPTCT